MAGLEKWAQGSPRRVQSDSKGGATDMSSILNWLKTAPKTFTSVKVISGEAPQMCSDTVMAQAYRVNMAHEFLADR